MDNAVITAFISTLGGVIAIAVSYYFAKRRELHIRWQQEKIRHCRELLSAMSELAIDNSSDEALRRFAEAHNTIAIIAPVAVVEHRIDFRNTIARHGPNMSREQHDQLLTSLVREIRRNLQIANSGNNDEFSFSLAGTPPRKKG